MRTCLTSLVVGLLSISCAHAPGAPASGEVELTTYDAVVEAQGLDNVRLKLPFQVKNPSRVPLSVASAQWKVSVDGEPEKSGEEHPAARVEAGASLVSAIMLEVPLTTTPEMFTSRAELSALTFRVTATLVLSGGDGDHFEAEWSGEFVPPRRPNITLRPQAERYGSVIEISFPIVVENLNPFALSCDALDYTITLDGTEVMRDTLAKGRVFNPGTETQFDLSRALGKEDLKDLAKRLAKKPSIPFVLATTFKAGVLQLTQSTPGEIKFSE